VTTRSGSGLGGACCFFATKRKAPGEPEAFKMVKRGREERPARSRSHYCGNSSNSMRRFCVRPAFVLLSAMGSSGPTPRVSTRLLSMPLDVR
jgi:hypothetical protein